MPWICTPAFPAGCAPGIRSGPWFHPGMQDEPVPLTITRRPRGRRKIVDERLVSGYRRFTRRILSNYGTPWEFEISTWYSPAGWLAEIL